VFFGYRNVRNTGKYVWVNTVFTINNKKSVKQYINKVIKAKKT